MATPFAITNLSIAANTTNANVLANSAISFLTRTGRITCLGNASAVGITHQISVNPGQDVPVAVLPSQGLHVGSTANAIKADEDLLLDHAPTPAGALVHSVVNTTGAAITVNFRYFVE